MPRIHLLDRETAGLLQLLEHLVGPVDDAPGDAGQLADLDAVAVVRAAGDAFPQEGDVRVGPGAHCGRDFHPGGRVGRFGAEDLVTSK